MKPSNKTAKRKNRRKKTKTSPSPQPSNSHISKGGVEEEDPNKEEENERNRSFNCLVEAFSSLSFDEVISAYQAAGEDANKAAAILSADLMGAGEAGDGVQEEKSASGGRRKKIITSSTGMVSSFMGKGYVGNGSSRGSGLIESKGAGGRSRWREEAEEFLFSMLGVECHLNFGVVRDVFCKFIFELFFL